MSAFWIAPKCRAEYASTSFSNQSFICGESLFQTFMLTTMSIKSTG